VAEQEHRQAARIRSHDADERGDIVDVVAELVDVETLAVRSAATPQIERVDRQPVRGGPAAPGGAAAAVAPTPAPAPNGDADPARALNAWIFSVMRVCWPEPAGSNASAWRQTASARA